MFRCHIYLFMLMMSLQMALTAADLGAFCLLHLALVTKLTWDRNSSADVAPLHDSLMYNDNRNSPASGKEKTRSFVNLHDNLLQLNHLPERHCHRIILRLYRYCERKTKHVSNHVCVVLFQSINPYFTFTHLRACMSMSCHAIQVSPPSLL